MCDVNDPRILNAYQAITEDEPTDWLLLGYKDTRNVISLYASGFNGLSEFREHITNEILFGFVRVDDRFIHITYVPDSVSGVRRARALVHSRSVANKLELSHAQITASSLSDMSDANIRTRLKLGQVPNNTIRPKRSITTTQRRRKSNQYSPSPSPSPMSERNLRILTNEDPFEYDRVSTPIPSSPTSVASSFAESSISTLVDHLDLDEKNPNTKDAIEAMFQLQLAKKKELEEARFRQFQRDQQEARFKRDQAIKQFEEEKQQLSTPPPPQRHQTLPVQPTTTTTTTTVQPIIKPKKSYTLLPKPEEKKSVFPQITLRKVTPNVKKTDQVQKDVRSVLNSYKRPAVAELVKKSSRTEIKVDLKPVVVKPTTPLDSMKEEPVGFIKKPAVTMKEPVASMMKEPAVSIKKKESSEQVKPELKSIVLQPIQPIMDLKFTAEPEQQKINQVLMAEFASVQTKSSPFWKRRYFILTNETLSFYKDEMAKIPISTIDLLNVTRLEPANEDEDTYVPNSFVLDTQTGDSYQVFADQKKIIKQMYSILQSSI
ncbi:hypothetical protein BD770DRAFT_342893 [Pilaira anomala]|nr:hypothetical protein BD770DRAFT_342893 [Pilaira anomala]